MAELAARGMSVWLDGLSRERLVSGSLADLVARDHVVGVTTNPTIFANAISRGDARDAQMSVRGEMGSAVRATGHHPTSNRQKCWTWPLT
ncbi:transaldolase family protein [Nonomuraea sp. CA-143628]|uniref:transaldolase family protein n=1 Tax=Nonomuraea sp. CA-143628 TaxID=3239997 RepID=UPI003D8AC5A6